MSSPVFIWDLDGTLLDSYAIIVSAVHQVLAEHNIHIDKQTIFQEVTATSVSAYIQQIAPQYGCDPAVLFHQCCALQTGMDDQIQLNPHAAEVLQELHTQGSKHFVYTHKGNTAQSVLDRLGIGHYFTEVVTSAYGFTRKPAPDGIAYLVEKYGLDQNQCYYVGDRMIDMVCAANAQIRSVLYLYSPNSHGAKVELMIPMKRVDKQEDDVL